ncbi:MAG: hypothetical protein IKC26_05970 [Clostridia bacterium]|nr:hypothetical protein [Clostridia bacterium]
MSFAISALTFLKEKFPYTSIISLFHHNFKREREIFTKFSEKAKNCKKNSGETEKALAKRHKLMYNNKAIITEMPLTEDLPSALAKMKGIPQNGRRMYP